jgi:hypothetical protein
LEGPIPSIPAFQKASFQSLRNNKDLCGNISGLEPCSTSRGNIHSHNDKTNKILVAILPLTLGALLLALFVYGLSYHLCQTSSTKEYKTAKESNATNIFSIWSFDRKIVYKNIIKATE